MPAATRVGDKSQCPADAHGCPGCAHGVIGPAVSGSPDVLINGKPALRVGDPGIHAACCGPNTWKAIQGSPNVFINGKPAHRLGDADQHCGGIGKMIEGSPNVFINDGGGGGGTGATGAGASSGGNATTGLGSDVDAVVNQSPTLSSQIEKLQQEGWTIQYGPAGGGSYANRDTKTIVVDSNEKGNPAAVTEILAHEAGHASYTLEPYVPPDGLTRQQYIDQNVQRHLRDEAEATLNNCQVRDEIISNGGPDIGVAGANSNTYQNIYQDYKNGKIDRNTARDNIANNFGNEHTSTTGETYNDYYGKPYADDWDKTHGGGQ